MWYICIMEYYSVFKKKDILTGATAWIRLEEVVLSEISQSQKDKYCMIPLILFYMNNQIHKDRK